MAVQVARLKSAGAVLLGKGNMGEWAFSPTLSLSSVAGAVRNPYDLDRTPAGSSGGPSAGLHTHLSLTPSLDPASLLCCREARHSTPGLPAAVTPSCLHCRWSPALSLIETAGCLCSTCV